LQLARSSSWNTHKSINNNSRVEKLRTLINKLCRIFFINIIKPILKALLVWSENCRNRFIINIIIRCTSILISCCCPSLKFNNLSNYVGCLEGGLALCDHTFRHHFFRAHNTINIIYYVGFCVH